MVPFVLLNIIVLLLIPNDWYEGVNDIFDWKGSIVFAMGIIMFIYGFSNITSPIGLILAIIGVVLLILFIKTELKVPDPILKMSLYKKNKRFLSK